MKKLVWFVLALVFVPVLAGLQTPPDSVRPISVGTRVISAEEMRQQGVARLTDLFDLVGSWSVATIDNWQRAARPPGAVPAQARTWQVWIDGQRLPWGVAPRSLNLLPVAVNDLERVEIIEGPAWHRGVFVPHGALHLHTREPERGASGRVSYWTGDEVGDAGPLRYVDPDISNVDHDGPDATGSVGYGSASARGEATVLVRNHIPTKPAQRRRIEAWLDAFPERELWGGAVQARVESGGGTHRLRAGVSSVRDFVFGEATAREVPLRRRHLLAGLNGTRALSEEQRLAYRVTYRAERLSDVGGEPFRLDGRSRHADAQSRWIYAGASTRAELTGRVQVSALPDHVLYRGEVGARVQRDIFGAPHYVAGTVSVEEGGAYLNGLIGARRPISRTLTLAGRLAWTERSFRAQRPLAHANRRGFPLIDSLSSVAGSRSTERTMHAEGHVEWQPMRELCLRGKVFWKRQRGLSALRRPQLAYDAGERAFSGPLRLHAASGSVAGVQVRARWRREPVRVTASALAQEPTGGDEAYRDVWSATPRWRAAVQGRWAVAPRFSLAARLRGQAGTRWANYAGADALSGGAYQADVPASWAVDLSTQKRFWDKHLRAEVMLRNVLNRPVRTHPLGVTSGLKFGVRATLQL